MFLESLPAYISDCLCLQASMDPGLVSAQQSLFKSRPILRHTHLLCLSVTHKLDCMLFCNSQIGMYTLM